MRNKLTGDEIIKAGEWASTGLTLLEIRAAISRTDVSLMCVSRALQNLRDFRARINRARATGDFSELTDVAEVMVARRTVCLPGVSDASASEE